MINCNLVKYLRRLVKIITAFWWGPHTQETKDGSWMWKRENVQAAKTMIVLYKVSERFKTRKRSYCDILNLEINMF
jgi:hypothetical protein